MNCASVQCGNGMLGVVGNGVESVVWQGLNERSGERKKEGIPMSVEGRIERVRRAWRLAQESRERNQEERFEDIMVGLRTRGPEASRCPVRPETRGRFEQLFARRG